MNTLLVVTALLLTQLSGLQFPTQGSGSIDLPIDRPSQMKLSGRITGRKTEPLPISLFSPAGLVLQAESRPDGTFEFNRVSPGNYTLRAPGFTPVSFTVEEGEDLNIDMLPMYSGPGFAVGGKVIDGSGNPQPNLTRHATLSPVGPGTVLGGSMSSLGGTIGDSLGDTLETLIRADGGFEFPSVPPGPYVLRMLPNAGAKSVRVDITRDTRDLQLVIPFQIEVTGRVFLEGRKLGPNATVQAVQSTFTSATGIRDDGTFKLRLVEGENQISLARLPMQFFVKEIQFGSTDITNTPLKVDSTTIPQPITIRLETLSLDVIPRVKVSGRINTTGQAKLGPRAEIVLTPVGTEGKPVEGTTKADGSFEFQNVSRGAYALRILSPLPGDGLSQIVVGDSDVDGLEIVVPLGTEVAGKVTVVDANGQRLPIRPNVSVNFRVSNDVFSWTFVRSDGTFQIPLGDNEYTTTVDGLPAGYSIKSISSGRLNLLKNRLILDGKKPPAEIDIILEYRPSRTR